MADAYTALARRYRSATFDQLVGQEAIAQTLKNAVKTGRVAHAFLLTGTRGVGKTSAARILAAAINCPNRTADGNPCTQCNSCKAIARGEDLDVIEIDGASNNSVDQVRELRQSAGIRPARSPFKIYIIDEVHMLTTGAFNALLKTLEEPPEHVKFIFATTDVHKVPPTIISRCQRFDFRNISTARIAEHLKKVVKEEAVKADDDALFRIARLGNGSMRDALSILDRVLSLGEKHVTDKIVEDLLGKAPIAAIGGLVEAIANGDAAAAITRADALLRESMGGEQLLSEVIEFLRNLMMVAICGEKTELLDAPADARPMYVGLAAKFDAPTLVHLIALCEQAQRSLKASIMQRPLIDALIVRLALSEQFSSIRELLAGGESGAGTAAASSAAKKKSDDELASQGPGAPHGNAGLSAANADQSPGFPSGALDAPAPEPEPEESIYQSMKQTMLRQKQELEARNAQAKRPGSARAPSPPAAPSAAPVKAPVEQVSDLTDMAALWNAARIYLSSNAHILESVLGGCTRVESLNPQTADALLVIPAAHQRFTNERAQAKLEEALRAVTGLAVRLKVQFVDEPLPVAAEGSSIGVVTQGLSAAAQRVSPELMNAIKNQPVVRKLMEQLNASVTHVEVLGTEAE